VTCGTLGLSTATVKLVGDDGSTHIACSVGTGPVDSAYKAVDLIVKVWSVIYSWLLLTYYFILVLKYQFVQVSFFCPFPLIKYEASNCKRIVSEDSHFNVEDSYGLLPHLGIVVCT